LRRAATAEARRSATSVVKDLRPIYTAIDPDHALAAREAFDEKWGEQLPVIVKAWRDAWEYVTPFMAYEPEVRRAVYTTRSRRSTGSCARPSRPRAASRAKTPPAS
jgi:transposase-like protein